MGRPQRTTLDEKDLKALSLYEEGKTFKEIADIIGVSKQYLYEMSCRETAVCGYKSTIFKERLEEIKKKKEDHISELTRDTRELCVSQIKRILTGYSDRESLKDADKKMVSLLTNSIAKLQPNVKIGKMSVSYISNFTLEELSHEYGRLRTAAEGPTDSRSVQEDEQSGPGEMYPFDESGGSANQEPEDP